MRTILVVLAAAMLLGATATVAFAHAGPPATSTAVSLDATETVPGFDCDGNAGVESHVFNGVQHATEFEDGHSHVTLVLAGTWNLDLPAPLPDYSGRFAIHESHTFTSRVEGLTITAPFVGRGSDGSRFNLLFQLRLTVVDGTIVVERIGFRCDQ